MGSARRPPAASLASPAPSSCSSRAARIGSPRWPIRSACPRPGSLWPSPSPMRLSASSPTWASITTASTSLVNNAGAAWRGTFGEAGWENEADDGAQLRRGRPAHRGTAAHPARLCAERDRQRREHGGTGRPGRQRRLLGEQVRARGLVGRSPPGGEGQRRSRRPRASGVHRDRGLPATELKAKAATRWTVSTPDKAAEAIFEAGPGGKAERYVPRPYALAAVTRILLPGLVRRVLSGGAASVMTTSNEADAAEIRRER